jgi:hypothetical protein
MGASPRVKVPVDGQQHAEHAPGRPHGGVSTRSSMSEKSAREGLSGRVSTPWRSREAMKP